ncbi:MAG: phosphatase PAP2 family protein [Bacteroidota bacterium]
MRRSTCAPLAALFVLASLASSLAEAQSSDSLRVSAEADQATLPPETAGIDVRLLRSIYEVDEGAFPIMMTVANESSYPVYFTAAPLLLGGTLLTDADTRPAIRLAISQAATVGATFISKRLVNRPRPYVAVEGIEARDRQHQGDRILDPYSFPSGHTSSAFAIATSLSASYPEWYVIVPSMAWASAVGVSRAWLGVHYPSDILVGAGLGAGTALLVHLLVPDDEDEINLEGVSAPIVTVRFPL